jgi:hypothetical protein
MNDDRQLRQMLGAHRGEVARATGSSPANHPDIDTLARHATNQLSAGKARAVTEHLLVCEDGRCGAFVRANAEDVDVAAALLYPEGEAKGMHARTFLCREALWDAFEDMAREQGAPVDDLLAEAMRSYARQRSYGGATGEEPRAADPLPHDYAAEDAPDLARTGAIRQPTQRLQPPTGEAHGMRRPAAAPAGAANARGGHVPTSRGVAPPPAGQTARPSAPIPEPPGGRIPLQRPFTAPIGHALPPPPPPRGGGPRFPSGASPVPAPPSRGMAPPSRSVPPPLPASDPYMAPAAPYPQNPQNPQGGRARVASLSLTYQNRAVEVTKERFVLGRSKSQADLVLDDANVSRQHAAIERVGDAWYLADLGSTNGCYIEGQRISRRALADGDVIEITTHQIRCTLR